MVPVYLSLLMKGEKSFEEINERYKGSVKELAEQKLQNNEIDQEQYNSMFE